MRIAHVAIAFAIAGGSLAPAAEMEPSRVEVLHGRPDVTLGHYSDRTLTMGLRVDRDAALLVGYTVKDRPFIRPLLQADGGATQGSDGTHLEVVLLGRNGDTYRQRIETPLLCFDHNASSPAHISGDTIVLHRDSVIVEVPEVAGFDRIEVARTEVTPATKRQTLIGGARLDRARFTPAGGSAGYSDLAIADPTDASQPASLTTGMVLWPENFADYNIYKIYGDPGEGARRINVTIVPDGYTYAEKGLMGMHAENLVAYFRNQTPYKEHDPFINYTLVYAYSVESGTDQCDCGIIKNTAMGTTFLPGGDPCGGSANRCLYYGSSCDNESEYNIVAAELRAPVHDTTIIMVNTTRYGGCGGQRAVYSAGNAFATEVALHEVGHTIAGLADEYAYTAGCGSGAGEINTSTNPTSGAWSEWIPNLGLPREGAQYYSSCIYRPYDDCKMRALAQPFCAVCNQRWALSILGHPRVAPSAPVESTYPPGASSACQGVPATFSIDTRLPLQAAGNIIDWRLSGPGFPVPTQVGAGVSSHTRTFTQPGSYVLTSEVIADTGFVKPERYGDNRQTVTWNVGVTGATGDADGDGCGSGGDCDNANITVYPGALQICDGLNNDCNAPGWPGTIGINEGDDDGDAFSECQGDCDDGRAGVRPGAPQTCDGLNNDCGDPSWPAVPGNEQDVDGDGLTECQGDCDNAHTSVRPGAPQICGDGLNNDCNDPSWPDAVSTERDDDGDGLSECQGDCDDANASVRPGGPQICGDGLNNDCLAPGWPSVAGTNDVDDDLDGFRECTGDCDDGNVDTHPGAVEVNDGEDNQCPGDPGHNIADEISGETAFPDPNDTTRFCWPLQSRATGYKVLRSASASFNSCDPFSVGGVDCIADGDVPAVGDIFFYLIRADSPFAGSWGQDSTGAERASACLPVCGNGVKESLEVCDGADLGGETCINLGFDSGTLACNASCSLFDTSRCRF